MSAASTPTAFATWNPPNAAFPIRYPLSLFRDIEFFIIDGYRRIPYGGLEVGAVLYGHGEPSGLTILAYQPIECQHSLGPSFTLSAFDLEQLGRQVARSLTTEEGEELEVVGWLVSNCRSDLVLTEQESLVYDQYFPGPRQVTVLAKPEKMKPTRFGFVARPARGKLFERVCHDSFILPLSKKGEATTLSEVTGEAPGSPVSLHSHPTLPPDHPARAVDPYVAAQASPTPEEPAAVRETPATVVRPDVAGLVASMAPVTTAAPELVETPETVSRPPQPEPHREVTVPSIVTSPSVTVSTSTPEPGKPERSVPTARVEPQNIEPVSPPPSTPPPESPPSAAPLVKADPPMEIVGASPALVPAHEIQSVAVSVPVRIRERPPDKLFSMIQGEIQPEEEIEDISESRRDRPKVSKVEIALGLGILCGLVSGAAWTYLHLQGAPIPLNAEVRAGQVVVSWPPAFTTNASQSSITTWTNGQPAVQALLEGEQTEGRVTIPMNDTDVTVQLHVSHWYEDRTGQIRVVRVIPPPPPPRPAPVARRPDRRFAPLPPITIPRPPLVGRPADLPPH